MLAVVWHKPLPKVDQLPNTRSQRASRYNMLVLMCNAVQSNTMDANFPTDNKYKHGHEN